MGVNVEKIQHTVQMNIKDAKKEYEDALKLSEGKPPFEDLIGHLIDSGYADDFQNDSCFDALILTHHMLNRTYARMEILTGGLGELFFETLEKPLRNTIDRIVSNDGLVRVLQLNLTEENATGLFSRLQNEYPASFRYVTATSSAPISHFYLSDEGMIRSETVHPPLDDKSDATNVKATVNFNSPRLVGAKRKWFDAIWSKLCPKSL